MRNFNFEKISQKQWEKDGQDNTLYNNIVLPKRSTLFSIGYDFFSPYSMIVKPGVMNTIYTGIKWYPGIDTHNLSDMDKSMIKEGCLGTDKIPLLGLLLYPRSSYAYKYGMRLINTVGVIDMDYYNNENNEGHIILIFTSDIKFNINIGDKICQGIITNSYLSENDSNNINDFKKRIGGFGSTGK